MKKEKSKGKVNDDDALTFKVITIGDSNVGKTSIIRRYIYNVFEDYILSTIGLTFCFKEIILKNGTNIKLKLVDTAGQEKYNALTKSYFKNVDGVLFIFDFHKEESFDHIEKWVKLFEENNNGKGIPKYLIGNKNDLEKKVEKKKIDDFINKYNYKFEECSALNNQNIDKIFQDISEVIYSNFSLRKKDQKAMKITEYEEDKKESNCICKLG